MRFVDVVKEMKRVEDIYVVVFDVDVDAFAVVIASDESGFVVALAVNVHVMTEYERVSEVVVWEIDVAVSENVF